MSAGKFEAQLLKTGGNATPQDALIELKERTIDNPGRGNCGFYAFAIGLMNIIQNEKAYNKTTMFDRCVGLDSSVKGYYEAICNYDFDNPNYELLEALHRMLRVTTFNQQLQELRQVCATAVKKDEYRVLVATSTYRKFAELYYGIDVDPRFNEFTNSTAIKAAIAKIDRRKVILEHEALALVPVFISLVYGEGGALLKPLL
ncbi:MAG: hypothetical protein ACRCXC_12555 [Legionella sp.]